MQSPIDGSGPRLPARILERPDGRRLAWSSFGPEDGLPLLFIAGAACGRSMVFGERHLESGGVRLLTMDRPGMGGSDPDPERTLASTAADYAAVLEAAGAEGAPAVANGEGAPFGLAVALSGACGRLLLISPADEIAAPRIHRLLPPQLRELAAAVEADPAAASAFLASIGAEGMLEMLLGNADDHDRVVYRDPAFQERYRAALDEGFARDGAGYVADTMLAMGRWGLPLERVAAPVEIWLGDLDAAHSPEQGEHVSARIPGARRRLVHSAGAALLWTHAREVIAWAKDPESPEIER